MANDRRVISWNPSFAICRDASAIKRSDPRPSTHSALPGVVVFEKPPSGNQGAVTPGILKPARATMLAPVTIWVESTALGMLNWLVEDAVTLPLIRKMEGIAAVPLE